MIHVITPLSRPRFAEAVLQSLETRLLGRLWLWWVGHEVMTDIPDTVRDHAKVRLQPVADPPKPTFPVRRALPLVHYGNPLRNAALAAMEREAIPGMVVFLDDDTEVHPDWLEVLERFERDDWPQGYRGFVVGQEYRDRSPRLVWEGKPNQEVIDTGMFCLHTSLVQGRRWVEDVFQPLHIWYTGDRRFFLPIWRQNSSRIRIYPRMASLYNSLKQETGPSFAAEMPVRRSIHRNK